MLFNSFEFIFGFLPITFLVFFYLGHDLRQQWASTWLLACSLFFYAWWNYAYVGLLVASITFNFVVGRTLAKQSARRRRSLLIFGIAANLHVAWRS